MHIVVKMKFGAHLYGMATENSDIDYKGVFLPSKEAVLLGRIPNKYTHSTGSSLSKNTKNDIDVDLYSLHYFIKLACSGQIVAFDMLHAPDNMILESSNAWNTIVKQKHKFYTSNLNPLKEYVRRQTAKYGIKGSRLNAVLHVLDVLKKEDPSKKMSDIWDKLPRIDHCHAVVPKATGISQYKVCGKSFQESVRIGYVIPILEKFFDDFGSRARSAAENRHVDWKAVSHALRATYQTREILTESNITFPLKEAPFLMNVKQGKLDYLTSVAPLLESLMDEVEELSLSSPLPEAVDEKYWEQFVCDTVENKLFSQIMKHR